MGKRDLSRQSGKKDARKADNESTPSRKKAADHRELQSPEPPSCKKKKPDGATDQSDGKGEAEVARIDVDSGKKGLKKKQDTVELSALREEEANSGEGGEVGGKKKKKKKKKQSEDETPEDGAETDPGPGEPTLEGEDDEGDLGKMTLEPCEVDETKPKKKSLKSVSLPPGEDREIISKKKKKKKKRDQDGTPGDCVEKGPGPSKPTLEEEDDEGDSGEETREPCEVEGTTRNKKSLESVSLPPGEDREMESKKKKKKKKKRRGDETRGECAEKDPGQGNSTLEGAHDESDSGEETGEPCEVEETKCKQESLESDCVSPGKRRTPAVVIRERDGILHFSASVIGDQRKGGESYVLFDNRGGTVVGRQMASEDDERNVLEHEFQALLQGLEWSWERHMRKLLVESSCLFVIAYLQDRMTLKEKRKADGFKELLQSVRDACERFDQLELGYISRQDNVLARQMAIAAATTGQTSFLLFKDRDPPDESQ